MSHRASIQFTLGGPADSARRGESKPLRVLILGDFSGRGAATELAAPKRVGIDDFGRAFERLEPSVPIEAGVGSTSRTLRLASLDDLHPDALAAVVPELRELRETARALGDPSTEAGALERLNDLLGPAETADAPAEQAPASAGGESDTDTLERLLGRKTGSGHGDRAKATVDQLIRETFGTQGGSPSASTPSSGAVDARDRIAAALETRTRRILRNPHFRDVERAWRSTHWLASRVEDDQAQLFALDLAKPALAGHLTAHAGRLEAAPLRRILTDTSEGGWDLIVGDYSFALSAEDIVPLATLGALAAEAEAPLFTQADLSLTGCPSEQSIDAPHDWTVADEDLARLWQEFRRHPAAGWIGLALPRFVLRYPYGPKNDPIERFELEELPVEPSRDDFVWGNPAFACALIMAAAHTDGGAQWPAAVGGDVLDLPTPLYRDGGGEAIQPPLELLFNERATAALVERGFIAFVGGRNTNRIAAPTLTSVADRAPA